MPLINLDDPALFGTEEPLVGEQGLATLDAANRRREQMWSAQKQPARPQAAQPLGILQEEAPEEMPVQEDPVTFFESPGMDFDEADPFVKDRKELFQRSWIQAFRYGKKFRNATDYANFVKSIPGYGPETHNLAMQMANQYMQPAVREDLNITKFKNRLEQAEAKLWKKARSLRKDEKLEFTKDQIPYPVPITTIDPLTRMGKERQTAEELAVAAQQRMGPDYVVLNAGDISDPKYKIVAKKDAGRYKRDKGWTDFVPPEPQVEVMPDAGPEATQPPQDVMVRVKTPDGKTRLLPKSEIDKRGLPKGAEIQQ